MKTQPITLMTQRAGAALVAVIIGLLALPQTSNAKGGVTDPIPGTSKSGLSTGGGGGGGKSGTVVTTPTPAPAPQSIVTGTLTFTSPVTIEGVVPQCTGSYHIDPYYPTLSLLTVDISASSVNLPDNSTFFVTVTTAGGTAYPFAGGSFLVLGGSGACSTQIYVTPGTTITGVTVTDILGTVILTGK